MPPYRIMTFDGGGVKGALMATLVKRISDKFPTFWNRSICLPAHQQGRLSPSPSLLVLDADTLVSFYSQANLRSAFSPSHFNWFRPKYSNANFRSLLKAISRATRVLGI